MITEDYVSFEVAKLLKEKGFDENVNSSYSDNAQVFYHNGGNNSYFDSINSVLYHYARPTSQMAMKWLKNKHNIFIEISVGYVGTDESIVYFWIPCVLKENHIEYPTMEEIIANSYEEAVKAALKYCLKNLV